MKTRLAILLPVAALIGCPDPNGSTSSSSGSSSSGGTSSSTMAASSSSGGTSSSSVDATPVRTILEDQSMFGTTSVRNLLVDPLFKDPFSFLPLVISAQGADYTFPQAYERTTPTNSSGELVVPDANTRIALLGQFAGGGGPFYVDVWVSPRADGAEEALPASSVYAQVGEVFMRDNPSDRVYELMHVPADDKTIDGSPWYHFVATVMDDLPPSCVMLVATETDNVSIAVAGAQVVPEGLRMNARPSSNAIVPFKAEKRAWRARDLPLIDIARENGPKLAPPPRLRNRLPR